MEKTEIWAVSSRRIRAFFRQQTDVRETDFGFCFGGCTIVLTELPREQGFWAVEKTRVSMAGPEADVQQIYHRFFIRFLSAGG